MKDIIKKMLQHYEPEPLGKQRKFAVLLPLIQHKGELHILYEVRSDFISQPGDTSFPGGAVEEGESFEAAAVREAMEELNLTRDQIQVLGEIDYIVTEYAIIHCFVAEITGIPFKQIRHNEECSELFVVPVKYLQQYKPTYYYSRMEMKHPEDFPFDLIPNGKNYRFRSVKHAIPIYRLEHNRLWGMTANLTNRFIELLEQTQEQKEQKEQKVQTPQKEQP